MTTEQVAKKLVELCQKGEFTQAVNTLYADNIVCVEAFDMNGQPREIHGLPAVRKKSEWWTANHTIHSFTPTGPFIAADKFAVTFAIDVTEKPSGQRRLMAEVAVYTVQNGKITRAEFLYKV